MAFRIPDWLGGKRKAQGPAWWQAYAGSGPFRWPGNTPVGEIPFVVLDLETTGLDPSRDRILSLGAVRVAKGAIRVSESWACRVAQEEEPVNPEAIEVHGLLPGPRAGSIGEEELLRQVLDYLGTSVLVGHHIAFDVGMVQAALRRHGGGKLRNPVLDTARLARRLDPPHRPVAADAYTLDRLCARYRIRPDDRHTAAGDAFLTAILFLKLLAGLAERGVRTWGELKRG